MPIWPLRNRTQRDADVIESALDGYVADIPELHATVQRLQMALAAQLGQIEGLQLSFKQFVADVERTHRELVKEHQADYGRLASSIDVVRGLATGGQSRGRARERLESEQQALALGMRVIEACKTPEGALALAQEIAAGAQANGSPAMAGRSPV